MNTKIYAVIAAALIAAPVASFAQSNAPLTRAEVRAQLVQLEKAGYNPADIDPYYPNQIAAAEARVAAQNGTNGNDSYGASIQGTQQSGGPAVAPVQSVYQGM